MPFQVERRAMSGIGFLALFKIHQTSTWNEDWEIMCG